MAEIPETDDKFGEKVVDALAGGISFGIKIGTGAIKHGLYRKNL